MKKEMDKIVSMKKADFDSYYNEKNGLNLHPARLLPVYKVGDEMSLTSILLSSFRLIKEFRNDFFSKIGLKKGGKLYVYTEVGFPGEDKSRLDGLIIIVSGGKINRD